MQLQPGDSRRAAFALNVGFGAATAAVAHLLSRRSESRMPLWRTVTAGAAAGAGIYAGKLIVARSCDGCGLFGRQVAALSGSVMTNAALGRHELAEVVLPVGPLRVHMRGASDPGMPRAAGHGPVHVKLDLPGAVTLAWLASRKHTRLAMGASLSAGAPVLVSPPGEATVAEQLFGVISIDELRGLRWNGAVDRFTLGHEVVHVLQYDQRTAMWSAPVETVIARRSPGAAWVLRYVHLGVAEPVWQLVGYSAPYDRRLTEREAWLLAGPRHERVRGGDEPVLWR